MIFVHAFRNLFSHTIEKPFIFFCSISLMLGNSVPVLWALSQEYTPLLIYLVAGEKHAERSINQKHVHKYQKIECFVLYFFLKINLPAYCHQQYQRYKHTWKYVQHTNGCPVEFAKDPFPILTLRNNSRFCGMYQLGIKRPNLFFLSKVFNTCHEMLLLSFQVWVIYSCLFKTL